MQVLFDKVAIVSVAQRERTVSGLYIPPSSDGAMIVSGVVVATGPLCENIVQEGDVVWYNKHNAFVVTIDDQEYRIIGIKELLVLERKKVDIAAVLAETKPLDEDEMMVKTQMENEKSKKTIPTPELIKLFLPNEQGQ